MAELQNSSRSYKSKQILLSSVNYQRDPWQTLAAAAPLHLSIADSGHSGQRVTASYRRSCTPSPAPQGNVNKGRLVVSRLTSPPPPPPAIATDTASSLTGLAYLLNRLSSKKKSADTQQYREGGGARGHCVTHASLSALAVKAPSQLIC